MTADEKLDLILNEMHSINDRIDKLESQISALKSGQSEIRTDIEKVSVRVDDTYNIAMEAWGQSTENRKLIDSM